ncbi:hypothetical protein [Candidatus Cardinium sp. TP]|uniref:hypothetical protein n=1 Tax=Candidatus Cardinium sp. TP TaxID=2961955 RepID=UPI0021AEB497|nr:hypothetical protein [Candidatus Cardinium sp. TP]MCT4696786.1 hypothetical protein [Candidatus Cardinium sp. TP]
MVLLHGMCSAQWFFSLKEQSGTDTYHCKGRLLPLRPFKALMSADKKTWRFSKLVVFRRTVVQRIRKTACLSPHSE